LALNKDWYLRILGLLRVTVAYQLMNGKVEVVPMDFDAALFMLVE
jgi:hypothetical protein